MTASVGHTKAIVKSDDEPAIKLLASCMRDMRSHATITKASPEYESQANGVAERFVHTV